jgi:hypothetical protein
MGPAGRPRMHTRRGFTEPEVTGQVGGLREDILGTDP